jgi:hypothetical protein
VLDITLAVNDQNLRVERALDWKMSSYHPIAPCTIASESGMAIPIQQFLVDGLQTGSGSQSASGTGHGHGALVLIIRDAAALQNEIHYLNATAVMDI